GEGVDAGDVVGRRVGRIPVLGEVHADDSGSLRAGAIRREPGGDGGRPLAVEAHPVDDRLVLGKTEEPRLRIARLRPRRHAADFEETGTERERWRNHLAVLVESGRNTGRVGKVYTQ